MCESAGPLNPRGPFPGSHGQPARVEVGGLGPPRTRRRTRQTAVLLPLLVPRAPERLQAGAGAASQVEIRAERGLWPWGISGK